MAGSIDSSLEKFVERLTKLLTPADIAIVSHPEELPYIAVVKKIEIEEGIEGLKAFQRFRVKPGAFEIYVDLQREWWDTSAYLLGEKIHRPPSECEKSDAYVPYQSLRYRALFAMMFPSLMIDDSASRSSQPLHTSQLKKAG